MKKFVLLLVLFVSTLTKAELIDGVAYSLNNVNYTAVVVSRGLMDPYKGHIELPIFVPYKGEQYKVVEINNGAFYNCKELVSLALSSSIQTIGPGAFFGCSALETISLMNVDSIGPNAFAGCKSLQTVFFPDNLRAIGKWAFKDCESIPSIRFNKSTPRLDMGVFEGCSSLTSIDLPDAYKEIRERLFMGCTSLESIIIPESVTKIEDSAFSGCVSLKDLVLPSRLTYIGHYAFRRTNIEVLSIPFLVTFMGDYAFYGCNNLKKILSYPFLPPEVRSATFSSYDIPLYVNKSAYNDYKNAPIWKLFFSVNELNDDESSGVRHLHLKSSRAHYYNLNGCKSSIPHKGINIRNGIKILRIE